MKLPCDHDDEVGLVCAECALSILHDYQEALDRLGLLRRYAGVWKSSGGPLAQYFAGRITKALDASPEALAVMKRTKLLVAQEEALEEHEEPALDVDPGDRVVKLRPVTLGETS